MWCKGIFRNWKFHVTLWTPVILSVVPATWGEEGTGKEGYGAFVVGLMAVYWMTECIPIPLTSFLPVILFPLFGILSTDRVTSVYLQDSLLFLLGGCVIALSFEYSNLHSRIALKVILLMGAKVSQLLFGIMATTMTLSMWMNNTSTTAMMVPIVNALIQQLHISMMEEVVSDEKPLLILRNNTSSTLNDVEDDASSMRMLTEEKRRVVEKKVERLRIMFLLGTAYASNIGGTGVITGSGTNLIALDLIRKDSEEPYTPAACRPFLDISFLDWMVFNVPAMLLNTLFTYVYLQFHFGNFQIQNCFKRQSKQNSRRNSEVRRSEAVESSIRRTISQKYETLGPIGLHEWGVLVLFLVMVTLWVFKDPQVMPGWDSLFGKTIKGKSFIKEATPTLLIAILLFVIPSKADYYKNIKNGGLGKGIKDPLLSWAFVQAKFPWGIFILLGGGASMALGAKESGLNKWFGNVLASSATLQSLSNAPLLVMILVMIGGLTTVASNTAVAAIITPIILGMSYVKNIHPLFLVLPATTVSSYAFILPVSTPPNAIVYNSSEELKLGHMVGPGLVINVVSILVLFMTTQTTSAWFFGFGNYEGQCGNMTLSLNPPQ